MSTEPSRGRSSGLRLLWLVAAFAVAFAASVDWTSPDPGQSAPAARQLEAPASSTAARTTPAPPTPAAQPLLRPAPRPAVLANDSELEGHPHPITAEHVRIQRELQLVQQLNDALDLRDAAQLRSLVAEYARHVPGDPNALAAGYERIADCLERPGRDTRELAREYYTRERASTLRRYVRRVCFDDEPPGTEAAKL